MLRINRMVCDTIDSRDFPVPRSVKHFKFEDEAAYDVNFFQNMEELESLQIGGDSKFPLLALGRLPSTLTELDIPYLNSLETCSGIPRKLKKWKLVYDEFDYSDSDAHHISMTTAGSNNVPRFEQLEELDIGCCSFSSLFQYGVFTNLKKLRMQVPHGGMSSEWELLAQRECRALEELQVISNHFPTLLFCAEYELPRLRLFKYQQSSETVDQTEEMEREHGVALHFPKRLERLELEVGPNLVLDMEKFSVPETLKVLVLRNNVDNCRRFEQLKLPPNLEIFAVRADGGSGGGDIDLKNFIFPLQLKQLYLEGFQCLDLTGSNLQDLNNLEHIKIENVQQENSRTFRDSEDGNGFVTTSATNQWRGEQRSALTPEHEI
ncbi:uncharacterized protein LODBEIA_P56000 [Lodderomyces beijingensis]|uniref:Uncharacterized protein n=1 Tax=Lodderomyces beijingensis TaxID=1775926 RepID=A0ABP0ZVM5_9ASCO